MDRRQKGRREYLKIDCLPMILRLRQVHSANLNRNTKRCVISLKSTAFDWGS